MGRKKNESLFSSNYPAGRATLQRGIDGRDLVGVLGIGGRQGREGD